MSKVFKRIKKVGKILRDSEHNSEYNAKYLEIINPAMPNDCLNKGVFVDVIKECIIGESYVDIYYICALDSKCYIQNEGDIKIYNYDKDRKV